MAPEQLAGKKVDRRADLWSLGVILYEMLWGRRTFDGSALRALMAQVRNPGDVDFPRFPRARTRGLTGWYAG